MSVVKNVPKKNFALYRRIRELLGHRALWLALLVDEAERGGLKPDFARPAIGRCGCIQGTELAAGTGTEGLTALRRRLFSGIALKIFEMKILETNRDRLSINFHYCPLVAAWQRQGYSDERIAQLCDLAMEGDRGIASSFGARLGLGKLIAKGDDVCELRFERIGAEPASRK